MNTTFLDIRNFLPALFAFVFLCINEVSGQRITGQSASDAFNRGDYKASYESYSALLESFPLDPLYMYGAGVSLVRLEMNPSEASLLLEKAMKHSSAIRRTPSDADFFLARAYQLEGRYDEAVKAYEQFSSEAGRKTAREYQVNDFIRQCNAHSGALASVPGEKAHDDIVGKITAGAGIASSYKLPEYIDAELDSLLQAALEGRFKSDSLTHMVKELEIQYKDADQVNKEAVRIRLEQIKKLFLMYQNMSDSLIASAGLAEAGQKPKDESDQTPPAIAVAVDTAAARKPGELHVVSIGITAVADDAGKVLPDTDEREKKGVTKTGSEVTSVFRINETAGYSADSHITVSESFPAGFFYTIQVAIFRNPVAPSFFKRLFPVFGIRPKGSDLTTYYSGLFRKGADASAALRQVRAEGFSDAFVVIFMNGARVSSDKAMILEKDWGGRALPEWPGVLPAMIVETAVRDTVPPTLLLRVEMMRSHKPVSEQQLRELQKAAGDRGLEILNPTADLYVYLVGKFLTFEPASSYADLLVRNGFKDAKVVAYLGNREIPLETALRLFQK